MLVAFLGVTVQDWNLSIVTETPIGQSLPTSKSNPLLGLPHLVTYPAHPQGSHRVPGAMGAPVKSETNRNQCTSPESPASERFSGHTAVT